MNIYVASSWRNVYQPSVVLDLEAAGHEVYDFRHPAPGNDGFHWSEIDPDWKDWSPGEFAAALSHPVAARGFNLDMDALKTCDACVLVLPCGRSAHVEAGYVAGAGKPVVVFVPGWLQAATPQSGWEPELMYKMFWSVETTFAAVLESLARSQP